MSRYVTVTIAIFNAVHNVYGAPQYDPHNPDYDANSPQYYDTPHPVYVPPQDYDSAATSEYASPSYAVKSSGYEGPVSLSQSAKLIVGDGTIRR